jgi:hypothetical protein
MTPALLELRKRLDAMAGDLVARGAHPAEVVAVLVVTFSADLARLVGPQLAARELRRIADMIELDAAEPMGNA